MARALPAIGDTVLVRVVGKVTGPDNTNGVTVQTAQGTPVKFPPALRDDDGFGWEKQPAPEPVYTAGSVYVDARGALFLRNDTQYLGDRWTVIRLPGEAPGQRVDESRPTRPLTRMIPEGSG